MQKYQPLRLYLRRQTASEVVLSFRQMETILIALLPKAALDPLWWDLPRSPAGRSSPASVWMEGGWAAELLSGGEAVRFTRLRR